MLGKMMRLLYLLLIGSMLALASAGQQTQSLDELAKYIWETNPVFVSHTHVDPDNIEGSVDELIQAGITTAVLNLTIDDGDWRSDVKEFEPISQYDPGWGRRFRDRLTVLQLLERLGKVVIVKGLNDIPVNSDQVKAIRQGHKIAIVIASEGSNQVEGDNEVESIHRFHEQGWLSTALVHQEGDVGHRLLRPIGQGFSAKGRFYATRLQMEHILIDGPHLSPADLQEILEIAKIRNRPVMVSHEDPSAMLTPEWMPVAANLVASGNCTGLIGVHSYKTYLADPPDLAAYAMSIDEGRRKLNELKLPNGMRVEGTRHLALGIDWFAHKDMNRLDWAGRDPDVPLKELVKILLSRYSYNEDQVRDILGRNMVRIMRASLNGGTEDDLMDCH